ncbi:hypothetical protein [Vibrio sp. HN007]|uniref:hypothetical protein n=1 Tax=Vibrio iocasae TaxID=3098914 RepID=UPI0035D4CDFF
MDKDNLQGYITIATGAKEYIEMAKYLALSVHKNDPTRPIALITDEKTTIPDDVKCLFSHVIIMPEIEGYNGCLNKLRINEFTPFEQNMFIDSDCLIVKNDMDRHWKRFEQYDVNLAGDKVTSGHWYNFDVEDVLKRLNIDYIVKMNSGVIYFKKGAVSDHFFKLCNEMVVEQRDLLSCSHRREEQIADEPFIGTALGIMNISPVAYVPEEGSLMITTTHAKKVLCDPSTRESQIYKPTGFYLLNRLFAKSWVRHTPSIMHFVKLKPNNVYKSACLGLENRVFEK